MCCLSWRVAREIFCAQASCKSYLQREEKFMKHASLVFTAGMALLCVGAVGSSAIATPAMLPQVTVNAFELERQEIALQTTIVEVDKANKTVTVKGPEGQEETVKVSGSVRDLSDLKPGDTVTTHYLRAVALQLLPANDGEPGVEYSGGAGATADAGDALFQSHHTETVTAVLSAVDVARHTVTLIGADGHKRIVDIHQLKQRDTADKLKPGELVRITFVEAVAISLDPKNDAGQAG
jgi:hypothetical protein